MSWWDPTGLLLSDRYVYITTAPRGLTRMQRNGVRAMSLQSVVIYTRDIDTCTVRFLYHCIAVFIEWIARSERQGRPNKPCLIKTGGWINKNSYRRFCETTHRWDETAKRFVRIVVHRDSRASQEAHRFLDLYQNIICASFTKIALFRKTHMYVYVRRKH